MPKYEINLNAMQENENLRESDFDASEPDNLVQPNANVSNPLVNTLSIAHMQYNMYINQYNQVTTIIQTLTASLTSLEKHDDVKKMNYLLYLSNLGIDGTMQSSAQAWSLSVSSIPFINSFLKDFAAAKNDISTKSIAWQTYCLTLAQIQLAKTQQERLAQVISSSSRPSDTNNNDTMQNISNNNQIPSINNNATPSTTTSTADDTNTITQVNAGEVPKNNKKRKESPFNLDDVSQNNKKPAQDVNNITYDEKEIITNIENQYKKTFKYCTEYVQKDLPQKYKERFVKLNHIANSMPLSENTNIIKRMINHNLHQPVLDNLGGKISSNVYGLPLIERASMPSLSHSFRKNVINKEPDSISLGNLPLITHIPLSYKPSNDDYMVPRPEGFSDKSELRKRLKTTYVPMQKLKNKDDKDVKDDKYAELAAKAICNEFSHHVITILYYLTKDNNNFQTNNSNYEAFIAIFNDELEKKLGLPAMKPNVINHIKKLLLTMSRVAMSIKLSKDKEIADNTNYNTNSNTNNNTNNNKYVILSGKINYTLPEPVNCTLPKEAQPLLNNPHAFYLKAQDSQSIDRYWTKRTGKPKNVDTPPIDFTKIDTDCDIFDADTGNLIASFRKKKLSVDVINQVNKYVFTTTSANLNRYGSRSSKVIDSQGKVKSESRAGGIGILGGEIRSKDRAPFSSFFTAHTFADELYWISGDVCHALEDVFKEVNPKEYGQAKENIDLYLSSLVLPNSEISTVCYYNFDNQTPIHTDDNKFPGKRFGSMTCFYGSDQKRYEGGYTVFPEYKFYIDIEQGDVLVADFEIPHGNTKMAPTDQVKTFTIDNKTYDNFHRVSAVAFTVGSLFGRCERVCYENSDDEADISDKKLEEFDNNPTPTKRTPIHSIFKRADDYFEPTYSSSKKKKREDVANKLLALRSQQQTMLTNTSNENDNDAEAELLLKLGNEKSSFPGYKS